MDHNQLYENLLSIPKIYNFIASVSSQTYKLCFFIKNYSCNKNVHNCIKLINKLYTC